MTITDSATKVANAVEAAQVASHLHPRGSFDLADHEVPNGREEIWRFTPLKRLRGLHDGSAVAEGSRRSASTRPRESTLSEVGRDDARIGSIHVPNDRVSAQAWQSFEKARVISIPVEAELDRPVFLDVEGNGATAFTHLFIEVGRHAQATVVLRNLGIDRPGRQRRGAGRRGRPSSTWSASRTGPTTPFTSPTSTPGSSATPPTSRAW